MSRSWQQSSHIKFSKYEAHACMFAVTVCLNHPVQKCITCYCLASTSVWYTIHVSYNNINFTAGHCGYSVHVESSMYLRLLQWFNSPLMIFSNIFKLLQCSLFLRQSLHINFLTLHLWKELVHCLKVHSEMKLLAFMNNTGTTVTFIARCITAEIIIFPNIYI